MKTGKSRRAGSVNAPRRMRIKSAHSHRIRAGGNALFTVMVTGG
jgi:hypothetical protein